MWWKTVCVVHQDCISVIHDRKLKQYCWAVVTGDKASYLHQSWAHVLHRWSHKTRWLGHENLLSQFQFIGQVAHLYCRITEFQCCWIKLDLLQCDFWQVLELCLFNRTPILRVTWSLGKHSLSYTFIKRSHSKEKIANILGILTKQMLLWSPLSPPSYAGHSMASTVFLTQLAHLRLIFIL